MKTWPFAVVGLVFLVLAGCRADPSVALLERQNRLLEDEVYRLQGVIEDYEGGTVQSCDQVETLETAPDQGEITRETAPGSSAPRTRRSPSRQAVQPPTVELPSEAQPPGEVPEILRRPAGSKAPSEPDRLNEPASPKHLEGPSFSPGSQRLEKDNFHNPPRVRPTANFEPVAQDDSQDVHQLIINRMLTGGFSAGNKTGDCGVRVALETRDAKGRRLEAPADVSIVVLDPALNGDAARLARWDLTADDTSKLFRGDGADRAMQIECPWPDNPPQHNRLHLFVRYTTRDGRKLQADQPIEVNLPGQNISRWMPAETSRQTGVLSEGKITSSQTEVEHAEFDSIDSAAGEATSQPRVSSTRIASRNNAAKLKRPVWSPERF